MKHKFYLWKMAYIESKEGRYDRTILWQKNEEREKSFYYSQEPILRTKTVFFYINGNDFFGMI